VNFAIVGCGLIGEKRARALGEHRVVACADPALGRAEALAAQYAGSIASARHEDVIGLPEVDAVIVATTNDSLASLALTAAEAGKHVLVEKPGGRRASELASLPAVAAREGVLVKVGFNHRFHPALWKAHELAENGAIGPISHIRGRYGHGGRPGYDREWRADPEIAGGGEMLDQGTHLIDLSRWFIGEFAHVSGHVTTSYWQMPVEDNGFISLTTDAGQTAWLHASCTEWKNLFSFEIFGRDGKLQIDGLGGSYGVERLTYYRMLPEMGPPETTSWEFPFQDRSWDREIQHFVECTRNAEPVLGSVHDAMAALSIVEDVYRQSGTL
jgi:predicted dehydrogenase